MEQKMAPDSAFYELTSGKPMDEAARRELALRCCEKPSTAARMALALKDLPEDIVWKAAKKACEDIYWGFELRLSGSHIPEDIKQWIETQICGRDVHRQWAFYLRVQAKDLSEEGKRRLELKVIGDPQWAYYLRRDAPDLPDEVKKEAELRAMRYSVLHVMALDGLHAASRQVLDLIQLGMSLDTAIAVAEGE